MRKIIIAVAIIATMIPATAKADCSGFLDCLFGFSERVETRQAAMTERERIQAEAQAEIARTQAEQAERVRQADAEVERVKQLRFESAPSLCGRKPCRAGKCDEKRLHSHLHTCKTYRRTKKPRYLHRPRGYKQ